MYSTGVNAGDINYFQQEGVVFKTYEGVMILTGYGSGNKNAQGVQSKEFTFSVSDKEVADKLMNMTGERVTLHYKKYFGALPWRGYQSSIVDAIEGSEPVPEKNHSLDEDVFI